MVGSPGSELQPTAIGLLLAHYNFDAASVVDSNGNRMHGAIAGSLRCGPGVDGDVLVLDGSGYVSVAASDRRDSDGASYARLWADPTSVPVLGVERRVEFGLPPLTTRAIQLLRGDLRGPRRSDRHKTCRKRHWRPARNRGTLNEWRTCDVHPPGSRRVPHLPQWRTRGRRNAHLEHAFAPQPPRIGNIVGHSARSFPEPSTMCRSSDAH